MKTLQKCALLLLAGVCFAGCSDATGIDEQIAAPDAVAASSNLPQTRSLEAADLTFDQVKAYLDECGYDTTTLTEHEAYFLIDSDMGFSKERLAEALSDPGTRMVVNQKNMLQKNFYRLHLQVYQDDFSIDRSFIDAVDTWNSIGNCAINFTSDKHFQSANTRFTVYVYIQNDPFISGASYPNMIHVEMPLAGKVGRIIINTNNKLWKQLDASNKKYAIMHALGHLVGCSHSDFMASQYPGTSPDTNSIMQNETGLETNNCQWQGFTMWDIDAFRKMYPLKPATYSITCSPEITGSDKQKMIVGTEYTLTANYDYAWVFNPIYSYEVIASNGVVSTSVQNNNLKLKFLKEGTCRIRITVKDRLNEKDANGNDYTFETEYHAYPERPTFTYPTAITRGEFCTFRMTLNNPDYPTITYRYTVTEELFDSNTARSATIENDGKGTARIRFNDYGKYKVTAEALYGSKSAKFVFGYTNLYRPEPIVTSLPAAPADGYTPDVPLIDTIDNSYIIEWRRIRIQFDHESTVPHRIACTVRDDTRMQRVCEGGGLSYHTIETKELRQVRLTTDDASTIYLPAYPEYSYPDKYNNSPYPTTIYIYPYAWVYYPDEDRCELLSES